MATKYHKNAVLTGNIDCYCLACDRHLRSHEDVSSHIEKPIHKKNLESTNYLDKYKEDHVRKVKKGYYCEFCNVLLQTVAKVCLHTAEQKHSDNKGIQLLRRLGNSVVSLDDVFITENSWNGFIEETCAICNTEFYSENLHKTEQKHILNLIQKEIAFGVDKTIYRKIDASSFQCLTCNMIIALSTIATHSKSEDHKKLYTKCRQFKPPVNLFNDNESQKEKNNENANINPAKNENPETQTNSKIRNVSPPKTQKPETDEEKDNKIRMAIDLTCAKMKNEPKANKNDDIKPVNVAKPNTKNETKTLNENSTEPCLNMKNDTSVKKSKRELEKNNVSIGKSIPKAFSDGKECSSIDSDSEAEKEVYDQVNMALNARFNSQFKLRAKKKLHKNPANLAKTDTEQKLKNINSITAKTEAETNVFYNAKETEPKAKNNDVKIPDNVAETDTKPINDKCTKSPNENTSKSYLIQDSNETALKNSKTEEDPVKEVKKTKGIIVQKKKCFTNPADLPATAKNTCNAAKISAASQKKTEENIEINESKAIGIDTYTSTEVNQVSGMIQTDLIQEPKEPKTLTNVQGKVNPKNKKQESSTQYEKTEVLENVSDYQKNGIKINFEIGTAFCKKCFGNVKVNCRSIEDHIQQHINKPDINNLLFTQVLNVNHKKTILKEVQTNETLKKVDQNHNVTDNNAQKPTVSNEGSETNGDDKALVKYVPVSSYYQNIEKQKYPTDAAPQPDIPKMDQRDPESFAKANKLTFNKGNKNAFCRLCGTRIPSSLRSMKEHVNGMSHKKKAAKVANFKPVIPKKAMKLFVKQRIEICNKYLHDIIINDRLCLTKLSYMMITENEVTLRCQACEVNLSKNDVTRHVESYFHERAMDLTPVVWNLDTEFVREVRPAIFHCGFCNQVVGCWEEVSTHLKCEEHDNNQFDANCRLQDHMPDVIEHRQQRERDFMRMFMNFF